MKNYGFQYPKVDEEKDYVLGASRSAPFEIINETGSWVEYLPEDEVQRKGGFETSSCTNFGTLNLIEILLKYSFGLDKNKSERYQAVVSGQKLSGNDPQKVMESVRKEGVIPEELLPFTENENTWEKYFNPNPMTKPYLDVGKDWLKQYEFKHEYIYKPYVPISHEDAAARLLAALKRSPVGVSVFAWEKDGEYYIKPQGAKDNHWCILVGAVRDKFWIIYDSYDSHIKKLRWDYTFDIAKGVYLGKRPERKSIFLSIWEWILNVILN